MKKVLQILILSRSYTLTCKRDEDELLAGLKKHAKSSKLSGRFSKAKLALIYTVGGKEWMPMPAVSINGFTKAKENMSVLFLKMRLSIFLGFFFIGGILSILVIYFLELFGGHDFGGISDSPLILLAPVAWYIILILMFLAFAASCKNYFDELIYRIESEKS